MDKKNCTKIQFIINKKPDVFFSILQQGFMVDAFVECSIKDMLCDQFNVAPDYLSERVSTIFLNGKPVDNVETAILKDGSILALSGAMPGLVGATFRKGGALSILRSSITHKNDKDNNDKTVKGMITLKLFNLLVSEMGPAFLKRGFWITSGALCDFIQNKKDDLNAISNSICVNSEETPLDKALDNLKNLPAKKVTYIRVNVL
ncbi:MAG: hypothetical protein GY707_12165 [Desulfobacteraceae bacterium]|nr:hypothetical protein [Desulfobacteraceae bacterium]